MTIKYNVIPSKGNKQKQQQQSIGPKMKDIHKKVFKASVLSRNHSLPLNHRTRINSLQKQLPTSHQRHPSSFDADFREESSAIMELLDVKDQQDQWRERLNHGLCEGEKGSSVKGGGFKQAGHKKRQKDGDFGRQQAQAVNQTHLGEIFVKKASQQQTNQAKSRDQKPHKHSLKNSNPQQIRNSIVKNPNNKAFLMNRTHYWQKIQKDSGMSVHELSLTQRFENKLLPNNNFSYKQHDEYRVNSQLEYRRNKSPLGDEWNENESLVKAVSSTILDSDYVQILPNKSLTVRQMLGKIKSHSDINLSSPPAFTTPPTPTLPHRQPFDPYPKNPPRQHYKKFTPYKLQQQKKIEWSLHRLEEHIKKHPNIENDQWEGIEVRFLEKPSFCSWVERNRGKVRRDKKHPLTVRPLTMLS